MKTPFDEIRASKKYKNYIDVDKIKEPHKYRLYNQIAKDGNGIIQDIDNKPWWKSVSIRIGCDIQKINNHKQYMLPPVTNRKHNYAIIPSLPKTKIIEKPLKKSIVRFIFKD